MNITIMAIRLATIVLGGYALTSALVTLGAYGMLLSGLAPSDAVVVAAMLGFLVYLVILLWGFCEPSLGRLLLALCLAPSLLHGLLLFTVRSLGGDA